MYLNLIPLYSFLHKSNKKVINDDLIFVDEINTFLADEDLVIMENAKESLFDIILISLTSTTSGAFPIVASTLTCLCETNQWGNEQELKNRIAPRNIIDNIFFTIRMFLKEHLR